MGVNKELPHLFVLPEDDANSRLADAFHRQVDSITYRQMQVLDEAGGWTRVVQRFVADHVIEMHRCPLRFMILLIDFDNQKDRPQEAKSRIPPDLADRVFILGALNEPEDLRKKIGSYEIIGSAMAQDCRDNTSEIWGHELLRHNSTELDRLRQLVRPILFA